MKDWLWKFQEALGNPSFRISREPILAKALEHPMIQNLRVPNRFFMIISDAANLRNIHVEGDSKLMTGYSPSEICENPRFLFELTHEKHLPFIMSAIQHAMKYAKSLDIEERENVSMTYFYEARKKNGQFLVIDHDSFPVVMDENGIPYIFCNVLSDLTNLGVSKLPQAKLVNHTTKEVFTLSGDGLSPRQSQPAFTPREIEILDLLVQGYNSRRIAEQLYISSETVRTHRKNILNKAEVHNTPELVAFALLNGIA